MLLINAICSFEKQLLKVFLDKLHSPVISPFIIPDYSNWISFGEAKPRGSQEVFGYLTTVPQGYMVQLLLQTYVTSVSKDLDPILPDPTWDRTVRGVFFVDWAESCSVISVAVRECDWKRAEAAVITALDNRYSSGKRLKKNTEARGTTPYNYADKDWHSTLLEKVSKAHARFESFYVGPSVQLTKTSSFTRPEILYGITALLFIFQISNKCQRSSIDCFSNSSHPSLKGSCNHVL